MMPWQPEILAGVRFDPQTLLCHEVIFAMIDIRDEMPLAANMVEEFISELEEGWFT